MGHQIHQGGRRVEVIWEKQGKGFRRDYIINPVTDSGERKFEDRRGQTCSEETLSSTRKNACFLST